MMNNVSNVSKEPGPVQPTSPTAEEIRDYGRGTKAP